jgi:putative flippase GtrA
VLRSFRSERFIELVRYYQAGVVNTLFGLAGYSALIALGVNIYAAQLVSHVAGMGFNYLTYSRHVFRTSESVKTRFVASYAVNYAASLATLAALSLIISNPYAAGILSAFIVSVANYFALRLFVFRGKRT